MEVTDARGRPKRSGGLVRWLARTAPRHVRGRVSIALVSDARMRALNKTYRRQDRVTDVLSFPAGPRLPNPNSRPTVVPNPESPIPTHDGLFLGDIVIATGVARRQARSAGHPDAAEFRVLALHGLLHLLGYDHERDNGEMRSAERRLRQKGGLRGGLIERTP